MAAHTSDTPPPDGEERITTPVEGLSAPEISPDPPHEEDESASSKKSVSEDQAPENEQSGVENPRPRTGTLGLFIALALILALIIGGWLVLPRTLKARSEMESGRQKLVLQDYSGARDAFQRSVESMPTYAAAAGASMLYLRDGNFQDAERFLNTAARLKPRSRETMILQARLSLFKYFMLNLNKEQGEPLHSRGMEDVLLANLGVELKEDYPDEAEFISETPTALKSHAEYLLRSLLEQNPSDVEVLGLIGALALYEGSFGDARERFEMVRELNPEFPALEWAFTEIDDPWIPGADSADESTLDQPSDEAGEEEISFPVPGGLPDDGLADLRDTPPEPEETPPLSVDEPRLPIDLDETIEYGVGSGGGVGPEEGGDSSNALSERLGGDSDAYQRLADERTRRDEAGTLYRFRPVSFNPGPQGSGVVKVEDINGQGGSVIPLGGERRFERLDLTIGVSGGAQQITILENGVKHNWVRLRAGWFADWEAKILLTED